MSIGLRAPLPALKSGDLVALEAPAGCVDADRVAGAVALLESRGLRVAVARDLTVRERYLAGSDAARLAGLQAALDDPEVRAVFLARGGYGSQRIAPLLKAPKSGPKPVVGFSDNTALLGFLGRNFGWPAVHGPHPRLDHPEEFDDLLACLSGEPVAPFSGLACHKPGGVVEAPVSGGCISLLSATVATPCFPDLQGKIVFLEDTCEAPYRVDRMLTHLVQSGSLDGVLGIVFGLVETFCPPETPVGEMEAVIAEFAFRCPVPVVSGLPCGHGGRNRPLPFGPLARFEAEAGTLEFLEPVSA